MYYPVVIHKDKDSDYGVTVPDLPGCFTAANSIEEAIAAAKEAIETHIEGMLEDGDPVSIPKSIDVHRNNPDYAGGTWVILKIDLSRLSLKAKRVNITLPERILRTVDHYAGKRHLTRSGLIAQAVTEYMAEHQD